MPYSLRCRKKHILRHEIIYVTIINTPTYERMFMISKKIMPVALFASLALTACNDSADVDDDMQDDVQTVSPQDIGERQDDLDDRGDVQNDIDDDIYEQDDLDDDRDDLDNDRDDLDDDRDSVDDDLDDQDDVYDDRDDLDDDRYEN